MKTIEERQVVCWNNLSEDEKSHIMLDIVSTRKPIDEDKLDEMATNWNINQSLHPHMVDEEQYYARDVIDAFKMGYRKAKDE